MTWTITSTQDDATWLDDYIRDVIAHAPPPLPPHDAKIGHVETHWHQVEPGVAFVTANPDTGTADDRRLAETIVMEKLHPHGYKRAVYTLRWDHSDMRKVADWGDVEAKAKRLVQTGAVTLKRNGYNTIMSQVVGDGSDNDGKPDVHNVEIKRDDPNSQAITGSFCDCGWGQFQNLPRTRQWKRFQNRPCAHILATYWLANAIPSDEERAPGNSGAPGQMSLFDQSGGQAPSSMGLMQRSPFMNPNAWWLPPNGGGGMGGMPQGPQMGAPGPSGGMGGGAGGAPAPEDVLPPFPMANQPQLPEVNPVSTPGGRPGPTPTNPIQYPGGTFSHVSAQQQYQNGDMVQLTQDTIGTLVGRSEEHGAGQQTTISAGSVGEVLGTDPVTQLVNVLFMGKQFDTNSYFEPFGASVWCWPSELVPSNNRPPGPAIRRT